MRLRTIGAVRVTGLILWTATVAIPQGIITTIAGTDFTYPIQPISALNAPLGNTAAVAFDARGNLYIADSSNARVFRLDQQGILTVVAGNGVFGFSGDGGPAMSASAVEYRPADSHPAAAGDPVILYCTGLGVYPRGRLQ